MRGGDDFLMMFSGLGTVGASSFADGEAAPSGFHWDFITDDATGARVTDDATGQPVVGLVAN